MKEVTDKLESIAAGVEEQSASVDEISTAITELSSNTVNVNEAIQESTFRILKDTKYINFLEVSKCYQKT